MRLAWLPSSLFLKEHGTITISPVLQSNIPKMKEKLSNIHHMHPSKRK